MNTCKSCKWHPEDWLMRDKCKYGLSLQGDCPPHYFSCQRWEAKPIEFEAEMESMGVYALSDTGASYQAGILAIRTPDAKMGQKYKVTLEEVE